MSVDQLNEDPTIKGQRFALLSFLSPEKVESSSSRVRGLKIRGVFSTREEAKKHSRYLRDQIDPHFDIYVGEVGKWLPWDDGEQTEDEEFAEKELNDLMRAYREQREEAKKEMLKRREDAKKTTKSDCAALSRENNPAAI